MANHSLYPTVSPRSTPGRWYVRTNAGSMLEPVPASTVVLVRRAGRDREVLLLRRPLTSAFAPDAWVFPGGRLDPADFAFDHNRLAMGPAPRDWGQWLDSDRDTAGAYPVAALREAWEETGILLAEGGPTADLHLARTLLLAGRRSLATLLDERGLRLATHRLRYFARWITPVGFPRRYDTRFFLAELEADARCHLIGTELVEARWATAGSALRAASRKSMYLLPPTVDTLRRLEGGEL